MFKNLEKIVEKDIDSESLDYYHFSDENDYNNDYDDPDMFQDKVSKEEYDKFYRSDDEYTDEDSDYEGYSDNYKYDKDNTDFKLFYVVNDKVSKRYGDENIKIEKFFLDTFGSIYKYGTIKYYNEILRKINEYIKYKQEICDAEIRTKNNDKELCIGYFEDVKLRFNHYEKYINYRIVKIYSNRHIIRLILNEKLPMDIINIIMKYL